MGAAEQLGTPAEAEEREDRADHRADHRDAVSLVPEPVEVRRNAVLAGAVALVSSAVSIAYLARATSTGSVLDWTLTVVLGLVAAAWLRSFADARSPLLVADAHGVRLRLGRAWCGLTWDAVDDLEHTPRRGVLRDGRLVVRPHDLDDVLAGLDARSRRQADWSRRLRGAPLAVPLGLVTTVAAVGPDGRHDGTEALQRLAERAGLLSGSPLPAADDVTPEADPATDAVEERDAEPTSALVGHHVPDPRPLLARVIGRVADRLPDHLPGRADRADDRPDDHTDDHTHDGHDEEHDARLEPASPAPAPLRETRSGRRHEVTAPLRARPEAPSVGPATVRGEVEVVDDEPWGERTRALRLAEDEPAGLVEPARTPVIGPVLAAARTRLGLSVDALAERTRIRPHVIEAVEVDDFVPCGGDFYARGHLRTLARVLGVDAGPLLAAFDERYADAPVDPRRVFEAELATGVGGSIRSTRGGPNWSVLVAVVMALVLCWSVARLVMDSPPPVRGPVTELNGSGGPGGATGAKPAAAVPVTVSAAAGGAHVVVRDGTGEIVFKGNLAIGESRELEASPPLRVQSSDGSVTVQVAGEDRGAVGEAGVAAQGTYVAP